jgi:hypothetical protein
MNIAQKWKQIRVEMRKFFSVTLNDIASNHDLAVEYIQDLPVCVDGFLDRHDTPRFIAVNSRLDQVEQSYAVGREISRLRQELRLNSMVLSSAKRWKLFDGAPEHIKKQILQLDLEHRALMMLGFWGKGGEYFTYLKRNPSKVFKDGWIIITTDYLFLRLRLREFVNHICWPFRAAVRAL